MEERICNYRGRTYSAREDGSILRHAKEGSRPSKLDEVWTYGKKDEKTGYMFHGSVRIHQVVATAFHGDPPEPNMVVDHKDTNRCNNRPENIMWVTRLENALGNPYTRRKIIHLCGSVKAFIDDPSILRNLAVDSNISWMRTVTRDEAERCRKNLDRWLREDRYNDGHKDGNGIGEWIFRTHKDYKSEQYDKKESLTPGAMQVNWKTPSEFPLTPREETSNHLEDYLANLIPGAVFTRNQYKESIVVKAAISENGQSLAVICALKGSVTPYALTKVTYEDDAYIHENIRSFFTEAGAEKYYTLTLGKEWKGGDVMEDYC